MADAVKPKRTISERLLNFSVDGAADNVPINLLLLPPQILNSPRLIAKTARLLSKKDSDDAEKIRRCYDQMLERVLSTMPIIKENRKRMNPCSSDQIL